MTKRKRLGELLRDRGHISAESLASAINEQQEKFLRLGEVLLAREMVSKSVLAQSLEELTRVPYMDCAKAKVDLTALRLIPRNAAQRLAAFPVGKQGTRLVVVMAEPQNVQALDELKFTSGMDISPRLGFRDEIEVAIAKHYKQISPGNGAPEIDLVELIEGLEEGTPEMQFISTSSRQSNREAIQEIHAELLRKRTPAVRLVSALIAQAAAKKASDIHIEPQAGDTIVRIRVDGVLRDLQRIPRTLQNSLVSRIKILSDMDIAERRAPQDGSFLVRIHEREMDIRVSTLPTQYGEKVVMRLLEPRAQLQEFCDLGLAPELAETLTRLLAQPQGMLLVTGPTGSGKSTTLYSALNLLRKPTVNIVTIEDPVEYLLGGVNQVQINAKAGVTFASCLRSILRQDPNIIMVGEIRDRETAEIGMKAAQTGHLVLSTLHTNDSISAVTRLLDLGIPGFMIASSVSGILAQRLVRRLCSCRKEVPASPAFNGRLFAAGIAERMEMEYVASGCEECDQTGYSGRIGVCELLVLDGAIRSAVRLGGRTDIVYSLARAAGMKFMLEYAFDRVRDGMTTLEEVLRVVPVEKVSQDECNACSKLVAPSFAFCPHCGSRMQRPSEDAEPVVPEMDWAGEETSAN